MTAGDGVCHTERSHPDDDPATITHDGLQTWVALPIEAEGGDPFFQGVTPDELPGERHDGVAVRMLVGSGWGLESPIVGSSPLIYAELLFPAGTNSATITAEASHTERAVCPIDHDVFVDDARVRAGTMAVLRPGSQPRLAGNGRVMVLGGEPVGQRYIWWNFVHSDRDRIEDAKAAWMAQKFPIVPGDHEPWVPLP